MKHPRMNGAMLCFSRPNAYRSPYMTLDSTPTVLTMAQIHHPAQTTITTRPVDRKGSQPGRALGCTTTTTIKDITINTSATSDTRMTVPRLAGNLPSIMYFCDWKYLW